MTERPRVPAAYEGRLANALTDLSSMPFLGRARSPILRPLGVRVRAAVGWDREGKWVTVPPPPGKRRFSIHPVLQNP